MTEHEDADRPVVEHQLQRRWHQSAGWQRVVIGLFVLVYTLSGAWLVVRAASMWRRRETATDRVLALAAGLVGVVWTGSMLVALTTGPESPVEAAAASAAARTTVVTASAGDTADGATPVVTVSAGDTADGTTPVVTARSTSSTAGAKSDSAASITSSTTIPAGGVPVLDVLVTIEVERETPDGYDRGLFRAWSDEDADGCDTRAEVLIRDANGTAQVDAFGCAVVAGDWYSPYDGLRLTDPTEVQIDHVVPLKEAWDSGARDWDPQRRERFANDLDDPWTLIAVSGESNNAKGAADPSNWMPPNRDDWCRYLSVWVAIKARWALSMDESEYGRIRNLLNGPCTGTTMPVGAPSAAMNPPSTTSTTQHTADHPIEITTVLYDAAGNDVVYNDSEYVLLTNIGSLAVEVGGWTVTDRAGHVVSIPDGYTMAPGAQLRLHTGPGDSTAVAYFAGFSQAIWNNSGGDVAELRDATGALVYTHAYTS